MYPPETIQTARLVLRRMVPDDAEAIFATYAQDEEVTRFLVWHPHRSVEDTEAYVASCIQAWDKGTEFTWAIRKEDEALIGAIALRVTGFKADFGYVLARSYWGNGHMAEALRPVVDWALAQPTIFRVWGVCDVENLASARVMEKVGMTREGILRRLVIHPQMSDTPRDCFCYSLVK